MIWIFSTSQESLLLPNPKTVLARFGDYFSQDFLEELRTHLLTDRFGFLGKTRKLYDKPLSIEVQKRPFPSLLVQFPNRQRGIRMGVDLFGRKVWVPGEWTVLFSPDLAFRYGLWSLALSLVWSLGDKRIGFQRSYNVTNLLLDFFSSLARREDWGLAKKGQEQEEKLKVMGLWSRKIDEDRLDQYHGLFYDSDLLSSVKKVLSLLSSAQESRIDATIDLVIGPHGLSVQEVQGVLEAALRDFRWGTVSGSERVRSLSFYSYSDSQDQKVVKVTASPTFIPYEGDHLAFPYSVWFGGGILDRSGIGVLTVLAQGE